MNTQGNTYTFLYAAIMVIVVATILSVTAISLQPRQDKNKEIEKKSQILTTIGKGSDAAEAEDKDKFIEDLYAKLITNTYVVNVEGEKVEGVDAFTVDLKKELDKPVEEQNLPVFEYSDGQSTKYILPVRGKGLWGPIWGYVALQEDMNTIYGVVFDHQGETPGLGAEINQDWFEDPFKGDKIFNQEGEFVSIEVVKGGTSPDNPHGVDAISGGTITSKGLEAMLYDSLIKYKSFFKKNSKQL